MEKRKQTLSPKEAAVYRAVLELFEEGADLGSLTVSEITGRAGIGKGTAYEYFSDKEEMIAKALFYNVELFCRQLYAGLCGEKCLYDTVNYILVEMERQLTKSNCILQLIHAVSDNSALGRRFRELEKETGPKERPVNPVINVLRRMLEDEIGTVAPISPEKEAYLVMSVFSKILCYGMLLKNREYRKEEAKSRMRGMVCEGVCREVQEVSSVSPAGDTTAAPLQEG